MLCIGGAHDLFLNSVLYYRIESGSNLFDLQLQCGLLECISVLVLLDRFAELLGVLFDLSGGLLFHCKRLLEQLKLMSGVKIQNYTRLPQFPPSFADLSTCEAIPLS